MYYPYFITYMLIGFVLSLLVFLWALNHGQFRDQDRARFLPLHGEPESKGVRKSAMRRIELYALLSLACLGLLAIVAVLAFALIRGH
jgi:cbb3-type cytochrome oxidase maturation protein